MIDVNGYGFLKYSLYINFLRSSDTYIELLFAEILCDVLDALVATVELYLTFMK